MWRERDGSQQRVAALRALRSGAGRWIGRLWRVPYGGGKAEKCAAGERIDFFGRRRSRVLPVS